MEKKRERSGVGFPTSWAFRCKNCGAVVPRVKNSGGPGLYCSECHGYTVA